MDDLFDMSGMSHDGSASVDEEQLTAAQVLKKLEEAWVNEKLAPDLLECKSEIVECIMEQMQEMEENIQRAKKGDLRISLCRLELDRIRYVVSSYLRCRLEKIEKYAHHFLEREKTRGENDPPRLSPEEFAFAKELTANVEAHFQMVALKHMPRNLQKIDELKTKALAPYLDQYVFLKVNRQEEGLIIDAETEDRAADRVDLEVDAQHLMRFRPIADLVETGAVSLI